MTTPSVSNKSKAQQENKVKQGDYQVAGSPLFVLSDTLGLDFKPVLGEVNTRLLVPPVNLVPVAFLFPSLC